MKEFLLRSVARKFDNVRTGPSGALSTSFAVVAVRHEPFVPHECAIPNGHRHTNYPNIRAQ